MSDTITQANRLLQATTPAGTDVLLLHSFSGSEGVSRPFRFTLKLVADVMNNMPTQRHPVPAISLDCASASAWKIQTTNLRITQPLLFPGFRLPTTLRTAASSST